MKILTWNVNGIRTLSQYHPWYTLKTCSEMLKELKADVLCFQEMKISRQLLSRPFAVPDGYDAVMSFPKNKGGYSGVAVYTMSTTTVALKAEEGLTGGPQSTSKVALNSDQRISLVYPEVETLELMPDALSNTHDDISSLDDEGRALVVDFGLFVLINVYCPNETSEERRPFKFNFHKLLEERVKILLREGREVIVLGDMNVVAAPIDHCEGSLESRQNEFWERPVRAWYRQWLDPQGPMVDVVRNAWTDREGMFTCWDTRTNARESNYGTRIDYVLLTKGLLPWFKHGDIQPDIRGSDHCPVFIELYDEITLPDGEVLRLVDKLAQPSDPSGTPRDPPPTSTRYWDEFSGKQKLLSTFFSKSKLSTSVLSGESTSNDDDKRVASSATTPLPSTDDIVFISGPETPLDVSVPLNPPDQSNVSERDQPSTSLRDRKRKSANNGIRQVDPKSKKLKKGKAAQQPKLASFFAGASKPRHRSKTRSSSPPIELGEDTDDEAALSIPSHISDGSIQVSEMASALPSSQILDHSASKAAWSQLMKPPDAPRCMVHDAPTKEYTVNKTGPNKGKKFFLCSLPMGPGYDSGKSTRLREEVDPKYRCNYFKWASDLRRERHSKEKWRDFTVG